MPDLIGPSFAGGGPPRESGVWWDRARPRLGGRAGCFSGLRAEKPQDSQKAAYELRAGEDGGEKPGSGKWDGVRSVAKTSNVLFGEGHEGLCKAA